MDGDKETAECRGEMSIVLLLCFANRLRRSYTRGVHSFRRRFATYDIDNDRVYTNNG